MCEQLDNAILFICDIRMIFLFLFFFRLFHYLFAVYISPTDYEFHQVNSRCWKRRQKKRKHIKQSKSISTSWIFHFNLSLSVDLSFERCAAEWARLKINLMVLKKESQWLKIELQIATFELENFSFPGKERKSNFSFS